MARKKKSPLYASILDDSENKEDNTKDTKSTDGGSILGGEDIMEAYRDKVHSLDATAVSPGPKEIDTSSIDKQIAAVEKPTSKSVWDKQAAYYRQQGEGQVLRNQKDWAALTQPTITLYGERIAASNAKYELLKEQMPEFDSSNIFGEEGPNKIPMPIIGEIKNISKSVKADMRELSRLNINDPRYDELRNKMEKDQQLIVEFDRINQQLIKIRNDKESNGSESDNWSKQMSEEEQRMWQDIYTGNGENIKIIDGKLQWVDPGRTSYDFSRTKPYKLEDLGPKMSSYSYRAGDEIPEGNSFSPKEDGTASSLEGVITDGTTGQVIPNQEIVVIDEHGVSYIMTTDETGTYTVPNIDGLGKYEFYSGTTGESLGKIDGLDSDASVEVEDGSEYIRDLNTEPVSTRKSAKLKSLDDDSPTYYYLNSLVRDTENEDGTNKKFENGDKSKDIGHIQYNLNRGGFTDADGNELEVDDEWGPKSQAAYDKYLEQKNDLEIAFLNENLDATQKDQYRVLKGKGSIRDLSKIGDEPTLRSAKAQKASFSMQNFMYNAIEKGANATGNAAAKSLYNEALGDVEFMYDKLNTREQASLLFDGMDEKDTRSVNTNSFVNSILEKNDMELSDLIEGGMLESYTDPETGKEMPLRQMFKNWYLDELYERTKPLTPTNITGGGDGSGGDETNFKFSNIIDNTEGGYLRNETYLPPMEFAGDTYEKAELFFTEGKINIMLDMDLGSKGRIKDLPIEKTMELLQKLYPNTSKDKIKDYVNSQIKLSKDRQTEVTKNLKTTKNTSLNNSLSNLLKKNVDIGGRTPKDYLLTYGDDDFVINSLNREFGKHGFTFRYGTVEERRGYSLLGLPAGLSDKDKLFVSHKNKPTYSRGIRFDTASESKDLKNTRLLIQIMNAMYNNDYIAVSEDVK